MKLPLLLAAIFWGCIFLLAARKMAAAQSPPAAYAAAILGVAAVAGLCLSVFIIWLSAA
ncbi:MAG TPA: hypothetical protein VGH13_24840 [Xanthobacteraceae bacterium]|jgi:hypothetical protein